MSAVVVGMVKVMRVLSVVNPIVLAILVGLWGRAAMMEGRAVGGAAGIAFAVVLASGVSTAMWMGKDVPMMARMAVACRACPGVKSYLRREASW